MFMACQEMSWSHTVVGCTACWDDSRSEQHGLPMQNDLQQSEAIAEAARHDREAAMAQASQAQNHLDQLSSTVQQLVQRNEQAAKVSLSPPARVAG